MNRFGLKGLGVLMLVALPSLANGQVNSTNNIYLVCARPSGSSTYLPGGLVSKERAGTVADAFSGVLNLTLSSDPVSKLIEATWIRESSVVSTSDPKEGGTIRNGYSDADVKRFDVDWGKGSSAIILVKGIGSGEPIVAYADIKAGYGLDKLSSYIALCAQFSSKGAADGEVPRAFERIKEFESATRGSIDDAVGSAADAASATSEVESVTTSNAAKAKPAGQTGAPKSRRRIR